MRSPPGSGTNGPHFPGLSSGRLALLMGFFAGMAVLFTLDGPGLTIDEPLDVRPGRTYVETLRKQGWHFFDRKVVDRVFRDNAEHPPLGRWLLGIASELGEPFEVLWKGPDPTGHYVLAGRLAPALAFAALVGLVTHTAGRRWGVAAGMCGRLCTRRHAPGVCPRSSGGSRHFLEPVLDHGPPGRRSRLACKAAQSGHGRRGRALGPRALDQDSCLVLAADPRRLVVRLAAAPTRGAGHARLDASSASACFGWAGPGSGTIPGARLQAYLGTGVARSTIMVQYFGQVVADRDVPWHYPWFYFAATVPVGLLALGAIGIGRGWSNRRDDPFPLLLARHDRALSGPFQHQVPVYDGERLFLHVFPAWAMLIGLGFGWLWDQRFVEALEAGPRSAVLLFVQIHGVVALHPFGLSYYNGLVGGLPGAERLGLELTYWNDPVDQVLLDRLATKQMPGASAALVPTLYPGQGILTTNRALARRDIILSDEQEAHPGRVACRFPPYGVLASRDQGAAASAERVNWWPMRRRQGVWLAAFWHFPAAKVYAHRSRCTAKPRIAVRTVRAPKVQILKPFLSNDLRNLAPSL